ncbi:MAG TPA: aldo/keto reductase [Geminicoccaceae bacterium]|nr:aldo/keto reductase [Geminicoccaceae bacterium]
MLHVTPHGVPIPALGLGTFRLNGPVAERIVGHALAVGYRHIDTAQMYGNETEVGAAIRRSPVPRGEIWLTTKIWPDHFRAAALLRAAEESVRRLGTEPDLLLLHWPNPDVPLAETVGALNEAKDRGLARHVGVSNFPTALLREAVAHSAAPLLVNQVEYHPYLEQSAVLRELKRQDMALTAYSPIGRGKVFHEPTLQRIGEAHGKNAVQVTLRWLLQQGVAAIPRSAREANVEANLAVFDFSLSDDEMAETFGLARPDGRMLRPATAPDWD